MNAAVVRDTVVRQMVGISSHRIVLLAYTLTLFLSAVLLFSVQPVFAKIVLPTLGGSPSVWAVSMCFFQAALLAGYCYAHILNRYVRPHHAPLYHLMLLGAALIALPFGMPPGTGAPPADNAYLWLLGVLTAGVGLPFFAVAANAPLLQAWFARTGHPEAGDPYFLYGASNLGSLLALLSYPVLLEPMLGLNAQSEMWTKGFMLLGLMILVCGLLLVVRIRLDPAAAPVTREIQAKRVAPVAWRSRLHWLLLAMVPSGLLVAYTTHLTTDLASAPFLWVIPLAVFLGTFIVVFCDKPLIPHRWVLALHPLSIAITAVGLVMPGVTGWALHMGAGFTAFLTTTLVCHRVLYERRPDSSHLTEFYLWMSLGGVLGGIFAGIAAPQLFNGVQEYPLLLIAGLLLRPGIADALRETGERWAAARLAALLTLAATAVLALYATGAIAYAKAEIALGGIVAVTGILLLVHLRRPGQMAGAAVALAAGLVLIAPHLAGGISERSFFGVHRILVTPDQSFRLLVHGTTVHGAQRLRDAKGQPLQAPDPATYYYPQSPMARGIAAARTATGKTEGGLAVGIVGLGAGSLTCYAKPNEKWTYFEIDPAVEKIARDPRHFTFMSRCGPTTPVVIGDARLTLNQAPASGFDYLLIDAFSSDAVPVHLMTREALELYLSRLAPEGLLALHISNRHMDLQSVAAATAASIPGAVSYVVSDKKGLTGMDGTRSRVFFIAKSERALAPVKAWGDSHAADPKGVRPWTDDYSDVFGAIWRSHTE